jgi:hypothetical protein
MPDAETITKWVAGCVGGLVLGLQGLNLNELTTVTTEQTHEMALIMRVHEEIDASLARQAEMIELLKKQNQPLNPPGPTQ